MVRAGMALRRTEWLVRAAWLAMAVVAAPLAWTAPPTVDRFTEAREQMVRDDIAGGGVTDPRVLESMRLVPRHEFLAAQQRPYAYFDMALPIGASPSPSRTA